MIRHLVNLGKGDQLTECKLFTAPHDALVNEADDVNCPDCRRSLTERGVCPACGEKALSWGAHPRNKTTVANGRLAVSDVETIFYLACDSCSETVLTRVDPETVAAALTKMGWRP